MIVTCAKVKHVSIKEPKIYENVESKIASEIKEESQVIVHCLFTAQIESCLIRIWETTFLYPKGSTSRSKLIHTENITLFPLWTTVMKGETLKFTLFFSALPKDCTVFDLIENISQSGGFTVTNVKRTESDVYTVILSE